MVCVTLSHTEMASEAPRRIRMCLQLSSLRNWRTWGRGRRGSEVGIAGRGMSGVDRVGWDDRKETWARGMGQWRARGEGADLLAKVEEGVAEIVVIHLGFARGRDQARPHLGRGTIGVMRVWNVWAGVQSFLPPSRSGRGRGSKGEGRTERLNRAEGTKGAEGTRRRRCRAE